jgi:hypothetical protein
VSAFRKVLQQSRAPDRVIEVSASAFASTWANKPDKPVKMGLRTLSEHQVEHAAAEAARKAWELHADEGDEDGRIDAYNNRLVGLAVAFATTHPENREEPYFTMAEDLVFHALTPQGMRFIYDALDLLTLETSPTAPEASDDELGIVGDGLVSGELLASLDVEQARRVRRILKHVLSLAAPVTITIS